jgi:MFS family permease
MYYKSLLLKRNYRLFLMGQVLSATGSTLSSLGLLWYVSVETGSSVLAGLIGAVWGLPSTLSFVTGAIADWTDRRRAMIRTDILSAILMFVLAIVIFKRPLPVVILLIIFALSLLRELFEAASFAFLPSLVTKDEIASANSLLNVSEQGAIALTRIIGGKFLSGLGVVILLVMDAISYVISAISLTTIAHQPNETEKNTTPSANGAVSRKEISLNIHKGIADIKTGLVHMWTTPLIREVVPWALPANAAYGAILVLLPTWISHRLSGNATTYGLMVGMGTLGFMAGAIIAPHFTARYKANWLMGYFTLLEASALFFFTFAQSSTLALLLYVLMNLFDGLSSPIFFSLLQAQMSEEHLGRIFGGLMTLLALGQPVGMAIGGLLAEYSLFAVFALGSFLISFAGLRFLFARPLRVHLTQ